MATVDDTLVTEAPGRDSDEGLFSRDLSGQLVRLDTPTEADYEKQVTLEIDGRKVTVALAEPLKDAQGNIVLDIDGRTTPRYTTIYDAAVKAWDEYRREAEITLWPRGKRPTRPTAPIPSMPASAGGGAGGAGTLPAGPPSAPSAAGTGPALSAGPAPAQPDGLAHASSATPVAGTRWQDFPIPAICHQPHMRPVAVCRVCMVHVYGPMGGKWTPERRLTPSCQRQVKEGMKVFTISAPGPEGDLVRRTVKVVTELLAGDHLKAPIPPAPAELAPFNELRRVADRCGAREGQFTRDVFGSVPVARERPAVDASSPVFLVDREACILCDRCVRACGEVKHNNVLGRSGKGRYAGIGFDLDVPMGQSSCVQCGECMVSCPTTAITFKPVARVKPPVGAHDVEILSATRLAQDPLLAGVPFKFLLWQEGLAVRRKVKPGEYLCRKGEPGNTAFFIKSGRLSIPDLGVELTPDDIIVGEMACLSGTPRTADLRAMDDTEVWEVRRNVLDRIMRSPTQRTRFEAIYRKNALETVLGQSALFQGIPTDEYRRVVDCLRPHLTFVRVSPGQSIFRQGDMADALYLLRLGHVRVGIRQFDHEVTVFYPGPGTVIGEIGLLALSQEDARKTAPELEAALNASLQGSHADGAALARAFPAGRRTASCSALDHVELARIARPVFLEMIREFPTVRRRVLELSLKRIQASSESGIDPFLGKTQRDYVQQGLYQGQSMLVLDLHHCTRCDLCTQACVQQHGTESHGAPITRLLREGLRFGSYLVATSCRSCRDAYCMIGCPVDSIHRGKHQQIVIESHCIGCGLCAKNCPYGNIFMMPDERRTREEPDPLHVGQILRVAQPKAAACDLCDADGLLDQPRPRCVYACPHDAAFRMTGEQLLHKVTGLEERKIKE